MGVKGSFIGFTFGNRHSSELGILRTFESDRFDIQLTPTTDIVTGLDTNDGQMYWGSNYSKKEIPISFAFYGMTEEQVSLVKKTFNDKQLHQLILDEEPYKVWQAKLTSVATMKHICFEHDNTRFYAGEGTFTFTAFYPMALSRYEYVEDYSEVLIPEWSWEDGYFRKEDDGALIYPALLSYGEGISDAKIIGWEEDFERWLTNLGLLEDSSVTDEEVNSSIQIFEEPGFYRNLDEWLEASGIPSRTTYGAYLNGGYKLYNAGDIEMPFKAIYKISDLIQGLTVSNGDDVLQLKTIMPKSGDVYIKIDTRNGLIRGCDSNKNITKNLYNNYIINGQMFEIPTGEQLLYSSVQAEDLEYHYLYL